MVDSGIVQRYAGRLRAAGFSTDPERNQGLRLALKSTARSGQRRTLRAEADAEGGFIFSHFAVQNLHGWTAIKVSMTVHNGQKAVDPDFGNSGYKMNEGTNKRCRRL